MLSMVLHLVLVNLEPDRGEIVVHGINVPVNMLGLLVHLAPQIDRVVTSDSLHFELMLILRKKSVQIILDQSQLIDERVLNALDVIQTVDIALVLLSNLSTGCFDCLNNLHLLEQLHLVGLKLSGRLLKLGLVPHELL